MSEIDFDELHSAVNELMEQAKGKKGKKSAPGSARIAPSLPSSPAVEKAVSPQPSSPSDTSVQSPKEETDTSTAIPVRRPMPKLTNHRGARGTAMDIVGPKPQSPLTPPSTQPKRVANTLHPTRPIESEPEPIAPATPVPPADEPPVNDDLLASLDMLQKDTTKSAHSEWPDPLEYHGFKDEAQKAKEPEEELLPATTEPLHKASYEMPEKPQAPTVAPVTAPTSAAPEPAATPFVTTKVEKRPLGAFADTPAAEPSESSTQEAAPSPEQKEKDTEASEAHINTAYQPAELSAEVVAVESAEPQFYPAPGQRPQPSIPAEAEKKPAESAPQEHLNQVREMEIPQQYHTSEKTPDKDARPVFDTKDYHPPIEPAHAAHRSGSPIGIVLILALLLVIAGVGAAIYLTMTGVDLLQLL